MKPQPTSKQRAGAFALYTSQLALEEAGRGDEQAAEKRLSALQALPLLPQVDEAMELAQDLIDSGILPEKASDDALHIALATVYGMDYLLTWNCRHIANAEIQRQIRILSQNEGYEMPVICTPTELMGETTP
ncbi:MAG: type II toxin-antitoxin system VapC family toxin [Gammaproteobacteria bacterium]|nr:type II toxin-antitoxin system VapC family toxin [Gammaproteobacteria bacterium]